MPRALGIDLAANPKNGSAWAVVDGDRLVAHGTSTTDARIVAVADERHADVVAIDAPLTPPDGRSGTYANRKAERDLRAAGFKPLPPSMLGSLTFRGMRLAAMLREHGFEVFPRATMQRLAHAYGGPKQGAAEVASVRDALARRIAGLPQALVDDHAADAIAAALTGAWHLAGRTEAFGDADEGVVWVPVKQP